MAKTEADILEREQSIEDAGLRLGDPEVYKDGAKVQAIEAERDALRGEVARALPGMGAARRRARGSERCGLSLGAGIGRALIDAMAEPF